MYFWTLILCGLPHERAVAYLCSQTSLVGAVGKNPVSLSENEGCFLISPHCITHPIVWSNSYLGGALEGACFYVQIWYLGRWDLLQTENRLCMQGNGRNLMWARWLREILRYIMGLNADLSCWWVHRHPCKGLEDRSTHRSLLQGMWMFLRVRNCNWIEELFPIVV